METTNYGRISGELIRLLQPIIDAESEDRQLEAWVQEDHEEASQLLMGRIMTSGRQAQYLSRYAPDINRLERIVSALESIGVNLDEEDIQGLELLRDTQGDDGADPSRWERDKLVESFNAATTDAREMEREREQENAVEVLTQAGFVLDDEDGETWTKDGVTVKIECVHPAESKYKWEWETDSPSLRGEIGISGEFHRLLALISGEVKS